MQLTWPLHNVKDHPCFQKLLQDGHLERQYSAAWYDNAEQESAESNGLDPAQHLAHYRSLANSGYQPASISLAWFGEGQPLVTASVWYRPIVTKAAKNDRPPPQAPQAVAVAKLGP